MAKRLNYEIGFTGDTRQLQQAIDTAVKSLQKLGTNSSFQLTSDLKEASKSALDLATNLQKAVNQNTGKLDLIDFEKSLKSSGKSLSMYADELSKLGPTGQQAFLNVASAITQAELPLKRSNKLMTELWVTMKNTARWQLTSSALHGFMGALSTAYGYSKDLDRSLNNIRIVSGQSAEEMKEFAEQANKAAKALSSTTTDYTDAALIYYQQGLDAQQVEERTNATIKMANVTGDTAQTVSDQMTAIWNNYDDGSKSLEYYADVITALGAATASSSGEIAQGLEKFSAIAGQVGLSYEYATSALATVTATTRESADVVGTAFKTLFARIQGLSLGETLDDGTNLNKYSEALQKVGISIFEQNGQLKAMDKILNEMGSKWDTLSNAQRVALAQTVAGVRQYNQLMTLMDNWDFFQENLAVAQGSEGELQRQADIYAESWEAARDRVRASAEDIYDSIINPDLFIELDSTLTPILSTIADLIDGMGGLEGAASIAAFAFTKLYGNQIEQGLRNVADNIRLLTGQAQQASRVFQENFALEATNLQVSLVADDSLQAKLHTMMRETEVQAEINKQADKLNQYQLQYLEAEKQKIALLKEEYLASSQNVTELRRQVETLGNSIYFDISLPEDWKDRLRNQLNNIKLSKEELRKFNVDLFSSKDYDGVYETITKQIDKLISRTPQIEKLKQSQGALSNINSSNMESFKQAAVSLGIFDEATARSITTVGDLSRRLQQQETIAKQNNESILTLGKALVSLGADSGNMTQYISTLKQLRAEYIALGNSGDAFDEATNHVLNRLAQGVPVINDWATSVTRLSQNLSQVAMAVTSIQSLGRIFKDEDATAAEKFTQTLMAMSMILPLISSGLASFGAIQTAANTALAANTATVEANNLSKWQQVVANKAVEVSAGQAAISVSALGKAFLTTAGPLLLILGVIGAVAFAIDKMTVSFDEASKEIAKANEEYEESKNKLDELNSSLAETSDRIKELEEQGSLTLVEQEELNKLRQTEELLKSQVELQEELTKAERQRQLSTIAKNAPYEAAALIKTAPGEGVATKDAREQKEAAVANAKKGTEEWQKAIEDLEEFREKEREEVAEWAKENSEKLQEVKDNYTTLATAVINNEISFNDAGLAEYQALLKEIRQTEYSEEEYLKFFIQPVLDSNAMAESKEDFIKALVKEKSNLVDFLNKNVRDQLVLQGISIEDYIGTLQKEMAELKDFLEVSGIKDIEGFLENLSAKDIDIMMSLDLQGFESFNEFYQKYLEVKNGVSITVELETARDEALKALQSLSAGEFLTDEQISALQAKFAGIFDLTNLSDMSMYDQTKAVGEAWMNAAFPKELIETNKEKLASMMNEWETLNAKAHKGTISDEEKVIQSKLELDIKDATKKLEELEDFELDPLELEIAGIDGILAQMGAVEKAASLIGDGFKVEAENVQELMKTMPELFEDAIVSAKDGSVQLSKAIVDSVARAAGEEIAITRDKAIKVLGIRIEETNASIDAINHLKEQTIANSSDTKIAEISDSNLTKAQRIAAAKAMLTARIQQAIQEKLESSTTAESAIYDQTQVTDSSAIEGKAVSDNWHLAAQNILKSLGSAFSQASQMQSDFAAGKAVSYDIGDIDYGTSNFTSGSSSYSRANFEESDDVKALRVAQEYVNNDFKDTGEKFKKAVQAITGENYVNGMDIVNGLNIAGLNVDLADIRSGNLADDYLKTGAGIEDFDFEKELENAASYHYNKLGQFNYDLSRLYAGNAATDALRKSGYGDGSGSSKSAKDESEALERYHEINRTLEDQERLLSEIEKQAERTFGLDRLKLYEKELEEINKKAAYEQIKMAEAGTYLDKDIQAIRDLGLNVQVNAETREITNWTAIMNQATAEYKAAIAGATEEEAQAVKDMYDNRIKAIEQYEESIDTFQEQQQKVWDALREARDAELRNTTYKLDVLLNVKNMKDAARDFSKEVVESFSDELYHGRESAKLGAEGAKAEMALLGEYQQQQADLQKLLDNADEFTNTEEIIAEMEELQGNVIASGEALLDWIETVETMLPEAIDAARERFSLFTDQLDHNTSVLDTIKELLSLQGVSYKTNREFNTLQRVSQEKLDAAVASAELQKDWFENARTELLEAQRALEQVEEGDAAYDTLKNNRDALLEEYNSAQEAMLQSAQEAMEVAREMFLAEIEKASYDFSQAISDGMGLEFLQERYDHLIEEEERYLDEVNTTYEQLKWNSKLQTAIDEASSQATKNQLAVLKEEFEQRKKNNEISQYDVDILNAKYEMIQKQIALEEAQNNKSQVRLVRNSQGNWDYQYTSDQSAIDDANAEYADAANEYYNIAKDQVKDITEEIVATWQECNERIREIYEDETLTVAEREEQIAEIRQFYSDKILYLEEQKNNALKDMTAAGGEIIGEYGNTYQDVIDLMQDGTEDFNEAFNDYLDDMEDAWNDYDETVTDVADSTGTSMEDLKDIIDDVSESTDDCREVGEELSEMMWHQIDDIHDLSREYAYWAEDIMKVVRALEQLAIAQGLAAEDAAQESDTNRDTTSSKGGYNASIDYAQIIGAGVQNGWLSDSDVTVLENERDAKIEGEGLKEKYSSNVDWDSIDAGSITKEQWEKLLDKTVSLNTGGYTGDFSDSKLAFLHEKELVLNQNDTENMLSAIKMVRAVGPTLFKQIEAILDGNAVAGANLLDMKMSKAVSADSTTQELVQHLAITAEFPNATDQNEIREAILGLANYATQVVNPR